MRLQLNSKAMISGIIVGAVILFQVAPVFALAVPAYGGKSAPNSTTCMDFFNGGVKNDCGTQVQYEIPIAVSGGVHTVTVSTNNPGGGTFQCTLYSAFENSLTTGGSHSPGTGNQTFTLQVTVNTVAVMYLYCNVNPGGIIYNVNY